MFGSLAFFAFYRDIRVLLTGTVVIAVDHLIRGVWFPESVFGFTEATNWRWLEHAAWVLFEDAFLAYACVRSLYEMKVVAFKRAEVENEREQVENLVKIRTSELNDERDSMKEVLDNINQGFFAIDLTGANKGRVVGHASSAVSLIFGKSGPGTLFAQMLGMEPKALDSVLDSIEQEAIPAASLLDLLPSRTIIRERVIGLRYREIRDQSKKIAKVLVVATDITVIEELELRNLLSQRRNSAVIKVLSAKNGFLDAFEMIESLERETLSPEESKRVLHTVKGSFSFLDCKEIADECHKWEGLVDAAENFGSVRYQAHQAIRSMVLKFVDDNQKVLKMSLNSNGGAKTIIVGMDKIERAIESVRSLNGAEAILPVMDTLLEVAVEEELGWLSEAFIQSAENLGKQANPIRFEGLATISAFTYRSLFKSFIHIVRNSADHGIEEPDIREMTGKPPQGQMTLKISENAGKYEIRFRDDGNGVDIERLKMKIQESGVRAPDSESEVLDLIFRSGVNTKAEVSTMAGRGVGLDAVREEARKFGGDAYAVNHPNARLEIIVTFKRLKHLANKGHLSLAA